MAYPIFLAYLHVELSTLLEETFYILFGSADIFDLIS